MNGERKSGNPGLRGGDRKEASAGGSTRSRPAVPAFLGASADGASRRPIRRFGLLSQYRLNNEPRRCPLRGDQGEGRLLTPRKNVAPFCGRTRGATEAVY
jgi:hypothetical protein